MDSLQTLSRQCDIYAIQGAMTKWQAPSGYNLDEIAVPLKSTVQLKPTSLIAFYFDLIYIDLLCFVCSFGVIGCPCYRTAGAAAKKFPPWDQLTSLCV